MLLNTLDSSNMGISSKNSQCRFNLTSLLTEDRVDSALLDMCLLAMSPGLIGEQIKADIRVCTVLTAGEQVPVEHSEGL